MLIEAVLENFKKCINRLEEVVNLEKTEVNRDSAIKRFELCFDLFWKAIKVYVKDQGVECNSPRDCIKTAFQLGLIEYNEDWLTIIKDRNLAVHIYKEEYADQVYGRLPQHLKLFKYLFSQLEITIKERRNNKGRAELRR